jgi:hypothetical protein
MIRSILDPSRDYVIIYDVFGIGRIYIAETKHQVVSACAAFPADLAKVQNSLKNQQQYLL